MRNPSLPPSAFDDREPFPLQEAADHLAHRCVVIDDQDQRRIVRPGLDAWCRTSLMNASRRLACDQCPGRRIVKVEPRPSSLSTVMSPPIIWQKRRLIASPRPVPPYLRVVEELA